MLDLAILLSAQPALPPARPDMLIDRPAAVSRFDAPAIARAERLAEQKVSAYEASISEYINNLVAGRAHIEAVSPKRKMNESELNLSLKTAEDLEFEAENRASGIKRFSKRSLRDEKFWFSRDPAIGAIITSMRERFIAADERAVEALLDQVLFVRAFRAERSPEAYGGREFDDPTSLDSFLKAELA